MPALSEGIWILAMRGRVEGSRRLRDSILENDAEARVVAVLAEDDPDCEELRGDIPAAWEVLVVEAKDNTAVAKTNIAAHAFPGEAFYGGLANDLTLQRRGLLTDLADAVPDFGLSYCDDSVHGAALPTHPCVGGGLVRAQGYWAFPESKHNGIDVYLHDVAKATGGAVYVEGTGFWHFHPCVGRAESDAVYALATSYGEVDRAAWQKWFGAGEGQRVIARVRAAMEASNGC